VYKFINNARSKTNIKLLSVIQAQRKLPARKSVATVVHVGAYTGKVAVETEKMFSPRICISYAIEPCPRNFKILKRLVEKHPDLHPIHAAVGARSKTTSLYIKKRENLNPNRGSSQSNSLYSDFVGSKDSKQIVESKVKVITLCDLIEKSDIKRIHLLRVNCEGGEFDIFDQKNSGLKFLNKVEVIALALHGKAKVFLTDEAIQRKKNISRNLILKNFEQVYGFKFKKNTTRIPLGHVWQIWVKKV